MDTIMGQIYGAVGFALAGIVTYTIAWALKKYLGIELDKNQQKQAKEVVMGIEEKALALLKQKKATGKAAALLIAVPTGPEKKDEAVEELKILNPDMTTKEAVGQVDRAVGSLPTVGAFQPDCNIPGA